MPYKSAYKLLIHLHELANISIKPIGYFCVRVEIVNQPTPSSTSLSIKDNLKQGDEYARPIKLQQPSNSQACQESRIEGNAWISSLFFTQNRGEDILMDQCCEFDLLLDCLPMQQTQVLLRLTLLFCKYHEFHGQNIDLRNHGVETVLIRINDMQHGLFHYSEANYSGEYLSKIKFVCFGIGTGFHMLDHQGKLISNNDVDFDELVKIYKSTNQHQYQYQQKNKREPAYCQKRDQNKQNYIHQIIQQSTNSVQSHESVGFLYQKLVKNLICCTQLLKTRVNEQRMHKKSIKWEIPSFIRQSTIVDKTNIVSEQQFFNALHNYRSNKLTSFGFVQWLQQIKQTNEDFVDEVKMELTNGLIDLEGLIQQFKKYSKQSKSSRVLRQFEYGFVNGKPEKYGDRFDFKQQFRQARKNYELKQCSNSYPLEVLLDNKSQIFIKYDITYSSQLIGKQLRKLKDSSFQKERQSKMIVILCHGFMSSASDMHLIKENIKAALPHAWIMMSRANQIYTGTCIDKMGERLAKEIGEFLRMKSIKLDESVFSFVGHSMGGLIARASLKYMPELENKLGFYCSIGTPHLGYISGGLTKTGLWMARKFVVEQSESLDQLSMSQSPNLEESFIYSLSKTGTLKNFSKIILISSAEDKYVPWSSAQIVVTPSTKLKHMELAETMIRNILEDKTVHRIDVNFGMDRSDLKSSLIGRKAHLKLVTEYEMLNFINAVLPNLFDVMQV